MLSISIYMPLRNLLAANQLTWNWQDLRFVRISPVDYLARWPEEHNDDDKCDLEEEPGIYSPVCDDVGCGAQHGNVYLKVCELEATLRHIILLTHARSVQKLQMCRLVELYEREQVLTGGLEAAIPDHGHDGRSGGDRGVT
jgi:hypothetical protein